MNNEFYFPFNIYLIEKNGINYKFAVNGGDINSFIFNTYRSEFVYPYNYQSLKQDSNLANKNPFYPRNSTNNPLFDFSENLDEDNKSVQDRITFTVQETCDVYLAIPKIPAGFYGPVLYTIDKSQWYYGNPPDFLNQFSVVTSKDEGFDEKYLKNINIKGDKGKPSIFPSGFVYLNENDFPGKIYIKIANVKIDNQGIEINYFFRSNVISPIRYLRLGSLKMRNIQIFFTTISETKLEGSIKSRETITIKGREDDPSTEEVNEKEEDQEVEITNNMAKTYYPLSVFEERDSNFDSPYLFNRTLTDIKNSCLKLIESKINFINQSYFYGQIDTGRSLGSKFRKNSLRVFRILIIYKDSTNGKLIIEKIHEDVAAYNELRKKIKELNDKNLKAIGGDIPIDEGPIEEKKPMTKSEAYNIIGLKEFHRQVEEGQPDKYIDLKLEDIVDLIGFED